MVSVRPVPESRGIGARDSAEDMDEEWGGVGLLLWSSFVTHPGFGVVPPLSRGDVFVDRVDLTHG